MSRDAYRPAAFLETWNKSMMLVGLLLMVLAPGAAQAVDIPIANSSFEDPAIPGAPANPYIDGLPTDWSSLGADGAFVQLIAAPDHPFTGGDGAQYGGLNGGGIYQDLGVPFQAGMAYEIDIAGAHRSNFTNGYMEFGVFSSDALGVDLGTPGFMDIQGVWSGSGNPDGDDVYDTFRDASVLHQIGSGALGRTSFFLAGDSAPTGNIVVYIRQAGGFRLNFDDIRLEAISGIVPGDVTGEGTVDLSDYVVIRDHFQVNVLNRTDGDLNYDGTVDFTDFLEWRANSPYGNASMAQLDAMVAGVPEPSACLLALVGFAAVALRRQRQA